jgi:hypothetical protein
MLHREIAFEYYILAFFERFKGIDADTKITDIGACTQQRFILKMRMHAYLHISLVRNPLVFSLPHTIIRHSLPLFTPNISQRRINVKNLCSLFFD